MSAGLEAARRALGATDAWLVGGAMRDRLLGRECTDHDIVVPGDPEGAARAIAAAAGRAVSFALSEEFGSWRVAARDGSWHVDVDPLRAATVEEDLRLRDFTVNAIAEPLAGGAPLDPLGGMEDLRAGCLRAAGPASFELDPLRVLRLVRIHCELGLLADERTLELAGAQAAALRGVSGERVFIELRRIVASASPRAGLELASRIGALEAVLPELERLRGVEQSRFHHADVYGHTLEVLDRTVELSAPGGPVLPGAEKAIGAHLGAVTGLLAEPLADGLTRGEALRWGALLHDAAKPQTRDRLEDGRVTFMGHDRAGAVLARDVLERLRASERMRRHVAGLVLHHLRLGFLVHQPQPLARRTVYAYLRACEPVGADVTLLSVADRMATRGERSEDAIAAHLELAEGMLGDALSWRSEGPPAALLRGDELALELGLDAGPLLGRLLEALSEAGYTGEVSTRGQAVEYARRLLAEEPAARRGA